MSAIRTEGRVQDTPSHVPGFDLLDLLELSVGSVVDPDMLVLAGAHEQISAFRVRAAEDFLGELGQMLAGIRDAMRGEIGSALAGGEGGRTTTRTELMNTKKNKDFFRMGHLYYCKLPLCSEGILAWEGLFLGRPSSRGSFAV